MIDAPGDVAELRAQAARIAARIAALESAPDRDAPERRAAWSRLVTDNAASPRPLTLAALEEIHGGPRPTPRAPTLTPAQATAREKKIRRNPGPLRAAAASWI